MINMAFLDTSELMKLVTERDTLKILFYLREFNPNVSVKDLVDKLSLDEKDAKRHNVDEVIIAC